VSGVTERILAGREENQLVELVEEVWPEIRADHSAAFAGTHSLVARDMDKLESRSNA